MLVLSMAPSLTDSIPTVGLDAPDHIPDLPNWLLGPALAGTSTQIPSKSGGRCGSMSMSPPVVSVLSRLLAVRSWATRRSTGDTYQSGISSSIPNTLRFGAPFLREPC